MPIALSDQTIDALAEVISGGSANDSADSIGLYREGWKIKAWFKPFGVDVDLGKVAASRHQNGVAPGRILGQLRLDEANPRTSSRSKGFHEGTERHAAVMDYLNRHLTFDGLRLEPSNRGVRLVEVAETARVVGELSAMAAGIDFDTTSRDLERALQMAESDPEIAVTAACAIIESVCRSILAELEMPMPSKQDISGLYREVREPLGLSPTKENLAPEIVNDVKGVLSGLVTSVQSIGSLRTHAGGAHGKERGFRRIDTRNRETRHSFRQRRCPVPHRNLAIAFPGQKASSRRRRDRQKR